MADTQATEGAGGALGPARRRILNGSNLLVIVLTAAAALWGAWWLYDRLSNVYVLDARVSADMLLLSSHVSGWVTRVRAAESKRVAKGELLIQIDDRAARAHLAELEAAVAVLAAEVEAVKARIELVDLRTDSRRDAAAAMLRAARSALSAAEGDLEVASADWQRAGSLRERNVISEQEWEAIRNRYRNAVQAHLRREAEVASAAADLAEARSERAEILVLEAELASLRERRVQAERQIDQARTSLEDHRVVAPVSGVVDELFIDPGEHVSAGQRILLMHDPERTWVSANIKETDLRYLAPGDRVQIVVDAYPGEPRTGVIRRLGNAATSQFALLPNPNPSGNFTKITQRLEATIDFEEHDPRLRPGMMVELKIPRGSSAGR